MEQSQAGQCATMDLALLTMMTMLVTELHMLSIGEMILVDRNVMNECQEYLVL